MKWIESEMEQNGGKWNKWNGMKWNEMKWDEMERNGKE